MKNKIINGILIMLMVITCYPMLFLVVGSFMSGDELRQNLMPMLEKGQGYIRWNFIPRYPTGRFYVELLLDTPRFFVMFWNSIKIALGALMGQFLVGVPAAWGFAKYNFPGRHFFMGIYFVLMLMPFQVVMLSNYLVLDYLSLLDSLKAIILPAMFATFFVVILYYFFRQVPDAIIEAAKIDGANDIQVFWHIGIPLGSSGILAVLVLGFLEYWNLIEQPLVFLSEKSLWPLSLFLPTIELENAGMAFVASIIMLLPSFLIFLTGQEYLEQGIVAVAVKE